MKKNKDMNIDRNREGMTSTGGGRHGSVGTTSNSGTRGSGSSFDDESSRLPNDSYSGSGGLSGRKETENDRVKDRSIDRPDDSNVDRGSDLDRDSRNRR